MEKIKTLRWFAAVAILVILILTILEFPAPVGFETRPQSNVSLFWLVFFIIILVVEIASIPLLFKKPKLGGAFGILAAILNILQILADQFHLMQPEVAPLGYTLLEYSVGLVSLVLAYFSYKIWRRI